MARKSRKTISGKADDREEYNREEKPGKKIWSTDLYLRISQREPESNSLKNQEILLRSFLKIHPECRLHKIRKDNGCSGTNFARRAFQEMLEDVKEGKTQCIMVKDLSRLGRNYLETGYYLEVVFPLYQVRFLSCEERYDSLTGENDLRTLFLPLKNLSNQNYAFDISKKVNSAFLTMREEGKLLHPPAVYGYVRQDGNWTPDGKTAGVVTEIFREFAEEECSVYGIVKKLNDNDVSSPGRRRYELGISRDASLLDAKWSKNAVKRILTNPVYIGCLIQGKYHPYKIGSHKMVPVEREKWYIHENHHPALVSRELFQKARERLQRWKEKKE